MIGSVTVQTLSTLFLNTCAHRLAALIPRRATRTLLLTASASSTPRSVVRWKGGLVYFHLENRENRLSTFLIDDVNPPPLRPPLGRSAIAPPAMMAPPAARALPPDRAFLCPNTKPSLPPPPALSPPLEGKPSLPPCPLPRPPNSGLHCAPTLTPRESRLHPKPSLPPPPLMGAFSHPPLPPLKLKAKPIQTIFRPTLQSLRSLSNSHHPVGLSTPG